MKKLELTHEELQTIENALLLQELIKGLYPVFNNGADFQELAGKVSRELHGTCAADVD